MVAQAGDSGRAEALAATIAHPYYQARALSDLAIAVAQAGNGDHAGRLLARAIMTDPSEIWWADIMSDLFPAVIRSSWEVFVDAYANRA